MTSPGDVKLVDGSCIFSSHLMLPWKMRLLPSGSLTCRGQRTFFPRPFGSDIVEVASSPARAVQPAGQTICCWQYGSVLELTNQVGQASSLPGTWENPQARAARAV